jgi:hypothetical protein
MTERTTGTSTASKSNTTVYGHGLTVISVVHQFTATDGLLLALLRFEGGPATVKEPTMLIPDTKPNPGSKGRVRGKHTGHVNNDGFTNHIYECWGLPEGVRLPFISITIKSRNVFCSDRIVAISAEKINIKRVN